MLTYGDLLQSPDRFGELEGDDVLVTAVGDETLVREGGRRREATMIFQHETIAIMRAERAEELGKLRAVISEASAVVPLRKSPDSMWDHITVGRASTSDILIDDPAISNVHAHFEIDVDADVTSVQDVGSSNGTHVNRRPLQPHAPAVLKSGDCVRFGQTIFYYINNRTLRDLVIPPSDDEAGGPFAGI